MLFPRSCRPHPAPPQTLLTSSESIVTIHGNMESRDNSISIDRITMEINKTLLKNICCKTKEFYNQWSFLDRDFHFITRDLNEIWLECSWLTFTHWCCLEETIWCIMWLFFTVTWHIHEQRTENEVNFCQLLRAYSSSCFRVFLWTTQTICDKLKRAWVRHMSYSWDQLYALFHHAQRAMWAAF